MGQIVQVDVSAQFVGLLHVLYRRFVRRKHDIATGKAAGLAHQQFGVAGAVDAAALFLQNFQDIRVRGGLDGKVLFKALVPAECSIDLAGVLADTSFIIQVEWRGNLGGNGSGLGQGDKRLFLRHNYSFLSQLS